MIHIRDRSEANEIGQLGFELSNFSSLPVTASHAEQVKALRADERWVENHMNDILRRIDLLREKIEGRERMSAAEEARDG